MLEHAESAKKLSRWAGIGLAAGALGVGLFYAALFMRDNAGPTVTLAGARVAMAGEFDAQVQRCLVSKNSVSVRGWAVRKGHSWPLTHSRVVLQLVNGQAVGLDTAWLEQPKLADVIHAQTHDKVIYYAPGFAASINTAVAGVAPAGAKLFIDWREGPTRVLLPLSCPGLQR